MDIEKIKKKILDGSPRQVYHELRVKLLKRKPNSVFTEEFPTVFVLSTGRAGTETLDALLNLAQNVFSYHEPTPTLYRLSKLAYKYEKELLAKELLRESFLTARTDLLKYSLDCGRGYVETSPQVTFLAPIILDTIPQARFIHVVRDPRAVIRSGMRRKWYDGHPNDSTRIMPHPDSSDGKQWNSYNAFQKNLWLWTETNRWIMRFLSNVPQTQKILLRAEDIFSGSETTVADMYNFIASEPPSKRSIKKILGKHLNAQENGEFPESSRWGNDLNRLLAEVAGNTAKQLGYEVK